MAERSETKGEASRKNISNFYFDAKLDFELLGSLRSATFSFKKWTINWSLYPQVLIVPPDKLTICSIWARPAAPDDAARIPQKCESAVLNFQRDSCKHASRKRFIFWEQKRAPDCSAPTNAGRNPPKGTASNGVASQQSDFDQKELVRKWDERGIDGWCSARATWKQKNKSRRIEFGKYCQKRYFLTLAGFKNSQFFDQNFFRKPKALPKSAINSAFKMGGFGEISGRRNWSLSRSRDSRKWRDSSGIARRRKNLEKRAAPASRQHAQDRQDQKEDQQAGARVRAHQLRNRPERVVGRGRHGVRSILKLEIRA